MTIVRDAPVEAQVGVDYRHTFKATVEDDRFEFESCKDGPHKLSYQGLLELAPRKPGLVELCVALRRGSMSLRRRVVRPRPGCSIQTTSSCSPLSCTSQLINVADEYYWQVTVRDDVRTSKRAVPLKAERPVWQSLAKAATVENDA